MAQPLGLPADSNVLLDQIVVGLNVFVGDGPVLALAVVARRLEIELTEAQRHAPPNIRPPARHAQTAKPVEGLVVRRAVRLVEIVAEPLVVVFGTDVKTCLDRPRLLNDR